MMRPIPLRRFGLLAFAAAGLGAAGRAGSMGDAPAAATPEQARFFEERVRPVLATKCLPCHGGAKPEAGVRLDGPSDLSALLGKGDPEKSDLVHAVRYTGDVKMPPSGALPKAQVADLEAWVRMGAPWPAKALPRPQDRPLWSLRPVVRPAVPKVRGAGWVASPIDAFVLARLEAKGLRPAAAADRRTLLRRVGYDLTGLPPTPEETDAFLADKKPGAYERVVDRLLASPRYGERWARPWLDVARYADTKGYAFVEDRGYPSAYTYRAWVIRALNDDLPYDRFVMDQLAADRLPEGRDGDRGALAALGYLTLGRRFLNDAPSIIDDRIDVTMRGMQGFTVACARCHDHKFDPIPTQDYYSLYAVFDSSADRTTAIGPSAVRERWEAHAARVSGLEGSIRTLVLAQMTALRGKPTSEEVKKVLQAHRDYDPAEGDALQRILPAFEPEARERLTGLVRSLDELRKSPPPVPEMATALEDRKDAHDGVVFKRGNPGLRGEAAPRRFLAALSRGERKPWTDGSGRLELARAIASPENPLTARVFVNRVWQGHFGAGLVRTPSDFGHQGEPPTHPELLDWLASDFTAHGWSMKRLHRQIVLSATYRQSADASPETVAKDPENRLLSRMARRRLDLESMRDSLMLAAGRLDLSRVGGPSVDLWARPFTGRRAVYGFVERQNLPGIFRTFDFASPDQTSARRFATTVPQQALFFLNSPFVVEEARALASRSFLTEAKDDGARVRRLYRLLYGRLPDADEAAAGAAYLRRGAPGAVTGVWRYGYGEGGRSFTPLGGFAEGRYQAGPKFPDDALGYVALSAQGGHPGRDGAHGAVRRWTAPADMTVSLSGRLEHGSANGDGVRARVVSSRAGVLGEWTARHGSASTALKSVTVRKGETLDFVVDALKDDNSDSFGWSPVVSSPAGAWDAAAGFAGPPPAPLSRLALYAQALLMTDEFLFVD